jgi:hypothetical protein
MPESARPWPETLVQRAAPSPRVQSVGHCPYPALLAPLPLAPSGRSSRRSIGKSVVASGNKAYRLCAATKRAPSLTAREPLLRKERTCASYQHAACDLRKRSPACKGAARLRPGAVSNDFGPALRAPGDRGHRHDQGCCFLGSSNSSRRMTSQDAMCCWAGTVNSKTAPRGSFAVAHNRPPCLSMIERQIDSPSPKPSGLVV